MTANETFIPLDDFPGYKVHDITVTTDDGGVNGIPEITIDILFGDNRTETVTSDNPLMAYFGSMWSEVPEEFVAQLTKQGFNQSTWDDKTFLVAKTAISVAKPIPISSYAMAKEYVEAIRGGVTIDNESIAEKVNGEEKIESVMEEDTEMEVDMAISTSSAAYTNPLYYCYSVVLLVIMVVARAV